MLKKLTRMNTFPKDGIKITDEELKEMGRGINRVTIIEQSYDDSRAVRGLKTQLSILFLREAILRLESLFLNSLYESSKNDITLSEYYRSMLLVLHRDLNRVYTETEVLTGLLKKRIRENEDE